MPKTAVLKVDDLSKSFGTDRNHITVLADVSFTLEQGDSVAIVGPSGSGKTTLLGLCAGLDVPTTGAVELCGHDLASLTEDQRAQVRNEYVGFVFQSFRLIPSLTALENVMVPAELRGLRDAGARAVDLLDRVGLSDRQSHYPTQLSGGEKQRVALARAFINRPRILFADEPTGNLDDVNAAEVRKLLSELNQTYETTLAVVTHDHRIAALAERTMQLQGGRVVSDAVREVVA